MSHILFPKTNAIKSSNLTMSLQSWLEKYAWHVLPQGPSLFKKISLPQPWKGFATCHPPFFILSFWMFQESSSPHTYPPPKLIQKKNPYPHHRRDVPHAPLPYPFGFSRGAPVPKHTASCCPDSYWQHKNSNACHNFYRVSWIWSSSEKTFVHVGKICHTRIFFVCSELLGPENKENSESKLIQPTTDVIIHWTFYI